MKRLLFSAVVAIAALNASSPAHAWSSAGIACVRAVGYQPADWEAYRVPPGPANKIRACFARIRAARDAARR